MKNADETYREFTSLEDKISQLHSRESSRYLDQAQTLLENGFFKITCDSVPIKYKFSGDQFSYQYNDKRDGSLQESELLAPESYDDQIEILKFIFAQSEAEVSL